MSVCLFLLKKCISRLAGKEDFIAGLREEYPDAELNFINAGLSGDGTLTKEQFFADEYHPTSYGHKVMAASQANLKETNRHAVR